MVGLLLLGFGLLATVVGWRAVWRVRAVAKRFSRHYQGPQVPGWVRHVGPLRLVPGVGEALVVWKRRARLAKLLALPVLGFGPLLTVLGAMELVHEVRGYHGAPAEPLAIGAFLAAAVLIVRHWRRARRPAVERVPARQDRTW
jgi:hypothetical protein